MSYVVLARKWRPMTFDDLVGQDHVARTLANAIASERVAHAFLFTGVRGVGKTFERPHPGQGAQLHAQAGQRSRRGRSGADGVALPGVPGVPGDRRGQRRGRARDRRRQLQRRGGSAAPAGHAALPPVARPLQDLHRRRGPHALAERVERLPQDAGGAAAAREVHLRDDRGAQSPGHHPQPRAALRLQAGADPADRRAPEVRARAGRHPERRQGHRHHRARSGRQHARRDEPAGAGDRLGRREARGRGRGARSGRRQPAGAARHRRRAGRRRRGTLPGGDRGARQPGLRHGARRTRPARASARRGRGARDRQARRAARPRRRGKARRARAGRPRPDRRRGAPAPGLLAGLRRRGAQRPAARRTGDAAGTARAPPAADPDRRHGAAAGAARATFCWAAAAGPRARPRRVPETDRPLPSARAAARRRAPQSGVRPPTANATRSHHLPGPKRHQRRPHNPRQPQRRQQHRERQQPTDRRR